MYMPSRIILAVSKKTLQMNRQFPRIYFFLYQFTLFSCCFTDLWATPFCLAVFLADA